jgi:hypothetical protein
MAADESILQPELREHSFKGLRTGERIVPSHLSHFVIRTKKSLSWLNGIKQFFKQLRFLIMDRLRSSSLTMSIIESP